MGITIRQVMDDENVHAFLDEEWQTLDPAPWTSAKCALVMERNGALIGAATCSMDAGVARLGELMIAARERNSGLGARLLAAFEEWATAQGAHKMTLHTRHHGLAQRFYERHGWRVAYVMENHYLRQDYAAMVKEPETP